MIVIDNKLLLETKGPPKRKSEPRMFGDSVQSSPVNTLGRKSGGSLSSLYQARKANDSATVEQIKQQFQKQIEQMMQASQRHESVAVSRNFQIDPPPQFRPSATDVSSNVSTNNLKQKTVPEAPLATRISVGRLGTAQAGGGGTETNIERGKSFQEARSAVQKQIEKMFVDSKEKDDFPKSSAGIKHVSHGVSHVTPEEEDTYNPPPPIHYGVNQALKSLGSPSSSSASSVASPTHMASLSTSRMSQLSSPSTLSLSSSQQRSFEQRNGKILSFDTSSVSLAGDKLNNNNNTNNNNINLGNIDMSRKREMNKNSLDRSKRSSMHEDLIIKSAGVALREKKNKEDINLNRRLTVHQDKFDSGPRSGFHPSSRSPPSIPLPSPPKSLPPSASSAAITSQSETEYEPISVPSPISPPPSSSQSSMKHNKGGKSKSVKHRIEYLGAVPLGNKATNLQALQHPLKELYFKNKALKSLGHSNLPGTLEILDTGMKIQYIRELHKGVQEIFNSFPTIAVWAAVKFVHKNIILQSHERRHRFAFCPLISDPESPEKTRTFYDLDYEEISLAMDGPHPPIFACVMRRAGMPKQLECHGFICQSSEDAIIIAANLYQSLLDTMRKSKASGQKKIENQSESVDRNLPRQELTRRSIRKSVRRGDPPIRPPRRKRTHQYDEHQANTGLVRRKSIRSSTRSARSNRSYRSTRHRVQNLNGRGPGTGSSGTTAQLPRNELLRQSTRKSTRSRAGQHQPGGNMRYGGTGDLFTKVSIGRTKSFVKTGNQYNLQELFRELKEKEGVDSIDDVLRRVISPDGMSFNDIKPVYRELLLKLAMTMSQDEIFQRSKTIMATNKKKRKRHQQHAAPANSGSLGSFFKSFSKSSSKTNSMASKKSLMSNSTVASNLSAKERARLEKSLQKKQKTPQRATGKSLTKADISGPIIITEKKKEIIAPKEDLVDDAYVSCSECGTNYESVCTYEPCSCRVKKPQPRSSHQFITGNGKQDMEKDSRHVSDMSASECDTDSCIYSEKCYCSLRGDPRHPVHSVSGSDTGHTSDTSCYSHCSHSHSSVVSGRQNLSGCDSPQTAWKRNMGLNNSGSGHSTLSPSSCQCSVYSDYSGAVGARTTSTRVTPSSPTKPSSRPQLSNTESVNGTLRRKDSRCSGSGYTSNDSYASQTWLHVKNGRNEIRDGRGSSGASSCSSSSHKSASSVRSSSSPRSSESQSSQVSIQNNRSQNSKILLVSAVDPRGNVMYKGNKQSSNF